MDFRWLTAEKGEAEAAQRTFIEVDNCECQLFNTVLLNFYDLKQKQLSSAQPLLLLSLR